MPIDTTTVISSLDPKDTFYDWWTKTNDEIIEKLNILKVFGLTHGSGISLDGPTSGTWKIAIGGTLPITAGLTFTGNVDFNGQTILPNLSFKVTGITTGTSGFTFGTPVYYDETHGYTASNGGDPCTAEVLGVISGQTNTYSVITTIGKIDGNFSGVAGSALTPGKIYFLSDTITGGITTAEPNTTGTVSKPVIYALGVTSGVVLHYRGNYLNSAVGAAGVTGTNRIFVALATSGASTAGIVSGKVVSYNPNIGSLEEFQEYLTANGNRNHVSRWFLSRSSINQNSDIGHEEDYIIGVVVDSVVDGANTIFEIATAGDVAGTIGSGVLGNHYLSNDWTSSANQLVTNVAPTYNGKIIASQYIANRFTVLNQNKKNSTSSANLVSAVQASQSTTIEQSNNLLLNGNFDIWQRDTGKNTGYTGAENLAFADMWRRTDGITSSATKAFSIERKTFDDYQDDVEGSPTYYIDVKCLGTTYASSDYITIGHVIPSAKALNDQEVTLSFYGKCSSNGLNVQVYNARYVDGVQEDYDAVQEFTLGTSWERFNVSFTIENLATLGGARQNDYTEVGFDFIPLIKTTVGAGSPLSASATVSIASVCLVQKNNLEFNHNHGNKEYNLAECRKYFYSSYPSNNIAEDNTMIDRTIPDYGIFNHIIIPTQNCNYVKYPVEMRTTPTLIIYSPSTGANDAFNQTSGRDCRLSGGTIGYNNRNRVVRAGVNVITTDTTRNGFKICAEQGIVEYDRIYYHIIADADFPLPS